MSKKSIEIMFFVIVVTAIAGFITTQRMVLHAQETTILSPKIQTIIDEQVSQLIYDHFRTPNENRLISIPFYNVQEFRNYLDRLRPAFGKNFGPKDSNQTFLQIFNEHMANIEKEVIEVLDLRVTKYIKDIDTVRPQIIKGIAERELAPFFDQIDPVLE